MNLNDTSLRLPKVQRATRQVPTKWKADGKVALFKKMRDGDDRYRLYIKWSPKLTLIHKHVFTKAQLERTLAKLTQIRVIDTRHWDKRYPIMRRVTSNSVTKRNTFDVA